ncbi:MAG: hypothetical protein GQ527_12985 [Bacteroidales bacterium]|nr:hypothetical protein [Bacteroidales bacterium]
MIKKSIFLLVIILNILFLSSCKEKVHDVPITPPLGNYETGIFIINEGNFGSGNGSISYINTSGQTIIPEIFQLENNRSLGDVVQSMKINAETGYICVNNSNKIEVVNYQDFSEQAVINNLPSVRFLSDDINGFSYASCWGSGGILKYINTSNNTVVDSIAVGSGPEGMFIAENKLFVANSGGLDVDHTVSVISLATNEVIKTLEVGYSPKQFVKDQNGMIWVLCSGTGSWSSVGVKPSKLVQIDPISLETELEIELFADLQPGNIGIDHTGTVIVIGGGYGVNGLYKIFVNSPETPTEAFIEGSFYGFSVNSSNSEVFITDAGDYTNNGTIFHYSFLGEKLGEYEGGIIPNGAVF